MKLFLPIFLTLAILAVASLGVSKKRSFNFSTSWGKRAATGSSKPDMESGAKGQNQKCSFNFSSSWGKRAGKTTNSESAQSPKPEMESAAKGQKQKRSFNFSSSWGKRAGKTTNSESEPINNGYLEQLIAKKNVSKFSHCFKKNNYDSQIKSK